MGRGCWIGGRLGLLPLIRKFECEVEQDFAIHGWDYRDRYRPKGGTSLLTVRRLLILVDALDRTSSRFWARVGEFDPLSSETIVLTDIWASLVESKEGHPLRRRSELLAEAELREKKKADIRLASATRKRRARQRRGD